MWQKRAWKIFYITMKYTSFVVLAALFTISLVPGQLSAQLPQATRKIVVFKEGTPASLKNAFANRFGVTPVKQLVRANAQVLTIAGTISPEFMKLFGVAYIEDDVKVYASGQVTPWGVTRIKASQVWASTTADAINVGVIDTGIDLSHPDLKDNVKGGYNAIHASASPNDDNGHGTHVAGIIGALNNTQGVVGIGPAINLYAIKVLASNGSGYTSDVIEGLDWAVANKMKVVNMSFGNPSYSQALQDAVRRVSRAGIVQVAAAGNSGPSNETVNYPAKFGHVIAVSALTNSNTIASFSSRGGQMDLAAPGVSIPSTYKGGGYATMSGTSMAAPHVAAAAALLLSQPAKCDLNGSGYCNPDEVKQRLQDTATDLGITGKDSLYGAGLVNIEAALQ